MRVVDFDLIKSKIEEIKTKHNISDGVAMDYLVCETLFGLDYDSSEMFVTDSSSINSNGSNNDDRGIDILLLNQDAAEDELEVTIVNCKYKSNFESASTFSFPTTEIAKVESALSDLVEDPGGKKNLFNTKQQPLIEEINNRYLNSESVTFNVIFCSNAAGNIDNTRFNSLKSKFQDIAFNVIGIDELIKDSRNRSKPKINGKIAVQKHDMFEVSMGFVAKINAAEILRLFSKNQDLRNTTDFELGILAEDSLNENILRDNVRKFKGVTNIINSNIIKTAKNSNECENFFYYNNGLTVLCNRIRRAPLSNKQIITLEGMQVVNGGQTIRCLDELKKDRIENLENIYLLCRFYEIEDTDFSLNVAEYTNSQTAVTNRDIKSIDERQRKLQELINSKGYFYQIKAKEFEKEKKEQVIDLEKIAQCLYAFDCESPAQARNNKKDIFSSKYDEIFTDKINANYIISLFNLSKLVIQKRNLKIKENIAADLYNKPEYSFVVNSDYFILYGIKKLYLKEHNSLPVDLTSLIDLYDKAYSLLQDCVKEEINRKKSDTKAAAYSNSTYFKNNKLKDDFDRKIEKTTN